MKNRILIGVLVLALATLACSVNLTNPTPTAVPTETPVPTSTTLPTNTPYPSPVPPTATQIVPAAPDLVALLLDNGFVLDGVDVCKQFNPCKAYWHSNPEMLVTIYGSGEVSYTFAIVKDSAPIADLLANLFDGMYPQEVTQWIGNNMANTIDGPQKTIVGNYEVFMQLTPAKSGKPPILTIIVTAMKPQSQLSG